MGWVTLSLRRMEDQVLHNNLQLELLGISRQRQQLARHKQYESLMINNQRKAEIKAAKSGKDSAYQTYLDLQKEYSALKGLESANKAKTDAENSGVTGTDLNKYKKAIEIAESKTAGSKHQDSNSAKTELETAQLEYSNQSTEYEETKMNINDMYDQQLQDLEEETTMEENFLDMRQTEIEAQLEAITQELQAVKQQVSTDIQNSTIKLG